MGKLSLGQYLFEGWNNITDKRVAPAPSTSLGTGGTANHGWCGLAGKL
jgi:hypothetical protein